MIPCAACRPSAIAVTTKSAPRTASPPAKDLLITGLVTIAALHVRLDPPATVQLYPCGFQPRHRMRVETKRHNDRIGRHHKFAAGDRRRAAAALCVRFAKPGTQKTHAADPAVLAELRVIG